MSQSAYVLTAAHDRVHLRTCPDVARRGITPWEWAQDRPLDEVRDGAVALGLKACVTCRPFEVTA